MVEYRPMLAALIGLSLFVSIWRIKFDEPRIITEYMTFVNENYSTTSYPSPILLSELPRNDFQKLVDLDNFSFLIEQEACGDKQQHQPNTLVLIHSAPKNWKKRITIRETWGRDDPRARVIFLLGAVNTVRLQQQLEAENRLFNDMIQGNFIDAYRNMTYKHVMALKWFTYNCPNAKYLLKTDDDAFVHSSNVYDYLDSDVPDRRNLVLCLKTENARVSRSYRSKWRVSKREYPDRYYPTYCPGFSVIYSADTAYTLYKAAQKHPYFWIDDVHITGIMTKASNITITPLGNLYLSERERDDMFNGYLNATSTVFFFTAPNLNEDKFRHLWKLIAPANS